MNTTMNAKTNASQKHSRIYRLVNTAKNRFHEVSTRFKNWRVQCCKSSSFIDKAKNKDLSLEQRKCIKKYTITKAQIAGIGAAGFVGGAIIGGIVGMVSGIWIGACTATVPGIGIGAGVGAVIGAGVGGVVGAWSTLADDRLYEAPLEKARRKKEVYTERLALTQDKIKKYKEAEIQSRGYEQKRQAEDLLRETKKKIEEVEQDILTLENIFSKKAQES